MIEAFKGLRDVSLTYYQLEQKIRDRGLVDYVVKSVQEISARVGDKAVERTFDGLALEAVIGEQLENLGIEFTHNASPNTFWYDMEFPAHGYFMDVKKHSNTKQAKWLSIHNAMLNPGNQLFHIRQNADLAKLYILFVNAPVEHNVIDANNAIMHISPTWIVRADAFFDNLKVAKTPGTSYFSHPSCKSGVDYIKFF